MKRLALAVVAASAFASSSASASASPSASPPASASSSPPAPEAGVEQPIYAPTFWWFLAQAIPSPEVVAGSEGAAWGLKWQLTAISYSWSLYRKISPWRFLVVDPTARHSGSIELYGAPEYVATTHDELFVRYGTRAYLPLWEKGEFLSASLGSSVSQFNGKWGAAYEAGIYGLGGFLGAQFTYSPEQAPLRFVTTLSVRFF